MGPVKGSGYFFVFTPARRHFLLLQTRGGLHLDFHISIISLIEGLESTSNSSYPPVKNRVDKGSHRTIEYSILLCYDDNQISNYLLTVQIENNRLS